MVGASFSRPQRNATLSLGRLLRRSQLLYFSQPADERTLYKAICGTPIRSIVEIGVEPGGRTDRVLEVASWEAGQQGLRYAGIDLFDARPAGQPRLTLKQAFAALRPPGVRVQLVPGDAEVALKRIANALAGTDLLLIAATADADAVAKSWRWVPRMLSPQAMVMVQQAAEGKAGVTWTQLPKNEVDRLAMAASRQQRQAA
jgi:hypothetical protein